MPSHFVPYLTSLAGREVGPFPALCEVSSQQRRGAGKSGIGRNFVCDQLPAVKFGSTMSRALHGLLHETTRLIPGKLASKSATSK